MKAEVQIAKTEIQLSFLNPRPNRATVFIINFNRAFLVAIQINASFFFMFRRFTSIFTNHELAI